MDYLGTVGPSPGSNFTTRLHGTKGNDFEGARAGLTEQGTDRGKQITMTGATLRLGVGVPGDAMYGACTREELTWRARPHEAVDECWQGIAGFGLTRMGPQSGDGRVVRDWKLKLRGHRVVLIAGEPGP